MLNALLLIANIATAQVLCTPPSAENKETTMSVCGADRVVTYSAKNEKVDTVTVKFFHPQKGLEKMVTLKKANLTVQQIREKNVSQSAEFKKELESLKKEWKLKEIPFDVSDYTFPKQATLYSTADLKTKAATAGLMKKINRGIASEGNAPAGGVRRSSGK